MNKTIIIKKIIPITVTVIIALTVFFLRPMGMDAQQSATVALILLVITFWTTQIVDKTIASCILILGFLFFSGAPAGVVLTFPRSEAFLLIALTYLFTRGIINSGIVDTVLEPILIRTAKTPFRSICAIILMLLLTIFLIPQPLARLIIVAEMFSRFLVKNGTPENGRKALLFAVFTLYIFINATMLRADIILNTVTVDVAGISGFSDFEWISYMAVPTLAYMAIVVVILLVVFRKKLPRDCMNNGAIYSSEEERQKQKVDWKILVLIVGTMALWITESLHGINNWIVTLISILIMFLFKLLSLKDFRAIDVPALVFLTAALAIGWVMRSNGAADIVFLSIRALSPELGVHGYIAVIMVITICMHMILGSNTTTVSVVIPGMVVMYGNMLPVEIIMFVVYITTATQWLLPFHSVGMMIGESKGFFPASYMFSVGMVLTIIVFIAMFGLYLPWWQLMGFL